MMKKFKLGEQLIIVCSIIIFIIVISLGIILPNTLVPVYETNVYNYLRQPLSFLTDKTDVKNNINSEIAYIYIDDDNNSNIVVSDNIFKIVKISEVSKILMRVNFNSSEGKFRYKGTSYYYVVSNDSDMIKIAITDDTYITNIRDSIFLIIFKVVGISLVAISLVVIAWANNLVNRIKKIRDKVTNINNDNYNHAPDATYQDELYTLDKAVHDMHVYLMEQEEYKNQMYQNISHDFKTPIAVMSSYIEAYKDGIQSEKETMDVMTEQLKKLENKVHSLLYLNKINYIQERRDNLKVQYDITPIIYAAVDKFKVSRPDVSFVLDIDKKSTIFRGSSDMWEAILDNILNNFMRYAKKQVKITVKNNKIILFNDGDAINEKFLNDIFTPYEKGVNGVFGLGLSIVKKTLQFLNYDISIKNVKNGVKFTIK